jgi:hypothetical protein
MTRILTFVCLHMLNTLLYAFFKASANVVRSASQRAVRDPKRVCHPLVLLDFVTPVVDVIVQNQLAFVRRQEPETLHQTVVLVAVNLVLDRNHGHLFDRDFFAPVYLAKDETRDSMKITRGLADISVANLGQLLHHAVDRLVGKILRVAEPFGHKYPDQTSADYFIFLPGYIAVWIKPG